MRKTLATFLARAQAQPHKAVGFICGLLLPLTVAGLYWAQTTGGLAGPLVDPRPPAFVVLTE